jgi:hypothetical protein
VGHIELLQALEPEHKPNLGKTEFDDSAISEFDGTGFTCVTTWATATVTNPAAIGSSAGTLRSIANELIVIKVTLTA